MATLAEIRQQHPEYNDLSDTALADSLYRKHYSDMDRAEFNRKVGYQPQSTMEGIQGFAGKVAQGATLGFADEIGAAIGAPVRVLTGQAPNLREGFQMARQQGMQETQRFGQEHPAIATAAEVGGALATAPAGGVAGAGRTLAGVAMRGALGGAGAGAVYGFGAGEGGLGARAQNAAMGAGVGAAGGAIAGVAAQQLGRAWRGFQASRAGGPVPQADREAMDLLTRNLRTLGYSDEEITSRINRAVSSGNSERALFEAFDEAHQPDLARTVKSGAQLSPAASSQARAFAETRRGGQQDRITEGFRLALDNKDFATSRRQLGEFYRTQGSPAYDAAYARPVQMTDALMAALRADGVAPLARRAGLLGDNMPGAQATSYGAGPARRLPQGQITPALQRVKEDMDDQIGALMRKGRGKAAGRLIEAKNNLLAQIDAINPEYAAARRMWAGAKADENALDAGRAVFTTDPEDLADMAGTFSESERTHFIAGVARAFREKIRGAADSHDATRRLASNNLRDRLRAALGEDADRVISVLDEEALLAANENALNPMVGSQTSPLVQGAQAFVPPGRAAMATAAETDLTLSNLRRAGAQALRTPDPRVAESYVDLMLTPQGQGLLPMNRRVGLLQSRPPAAPVPAGQAGYVGGLLANSRR